MQVLHNGFRCERHPPVSQFTIDAERLLDAAGNGANRVVRSIGVRLLFHDVQAHGNTADRAFVQGH